MGFNRTAALLIISVFWIISFEFGCFHRREDNIATEKSVPNSVQLLINDIRELKESEEWNSFSDSDWDLYLAVAKKMLRMADSEVYQIFSECDEKEDQDKLFLLNRILFQQNGKHPEFFGSYQVPDNFPGELYEWPIQWQDNRPKFFSTARSFDGKPYNGLSDYVQRKKSLTLRKFTEN